MNENLAATLGELQAEIYWLHDAEKFTEKLGLKPRCSTTAFNSLMY
ncbi:hypothetical protein [Nodularia sp. NIES-3585]|nr:hypothetical protein [Nodularia sp. NIES-3585]GAX35983.1 hypothetical protein NIES3585_20030 [Nodularia sp. NIES-3585]